MATEQEKTETEKRLTVSQEMERIAAEALDKRLGKVFVECPECESLVKRKRAKTVGCCGKILVGDGTSEHWEVKPETPKTLPKREGYRGLLGE